MAVDLANGRTDDTGDDVHGNGKTRDERAVRPSPKAKAAPKP